MQSLVQKVPAERPRRQVRVGGKARLRHGLALALALAWHRGGGGARRCPKPLPGVGTWVGAVRVGLVSGWGCALGLGRALGRGPPVEEGDWVGAFSKVNDAALCLTCCVDWAFWCDTIRQPAT